MSQWARQAAERRRHLMSLFARATAEEQHFLGRLIVGELRQGALDQVTDDHSLVNLYAANPELAAKLGPANENVIVRAVGLREEVEVDHRAIAMEEGDMYLLCSDGLYYCPPCRQACGYRVSD